MNLFCILFAISQFVYSVSSYNINEANITLHLSGSAYCGKENYNTMKLYEPANEFQIDTILHDITTDLQGFVGYIANRKTIYVVFRGSSSPLNWVEDLEIKKVPYTTFATCNCEIHKGFYNSALAVKDMVVYSVMKLNKMLRYDTIIVTGHSYGAAVSQIIGMELINLGILCQVYNFGQPRIGDDKYAAFVNSKLMNYWRFTHNKDIVPHVPPMTGLSYMHSCGEIFENEYGDLTTCSIKNCEDKMCADQYSLKETNGDDHKVYLQHSLDCEANAVIYNYNKKHKYYKLL